MNCMIWSVFHSLNGFSGIAVGGFDGDGFSFVGVKLGRDMAISMITIFTVKFDQ